MIKEKDIMEIIKEFAASEEGKRAIKKKFGVEYDDKFTIDKAKAFGEQMKTILAANPTMQEIHVGVNDIVVEEPIKTENGIQVTISFVPGSLGRESLYVDEYFGDDALQDIVLLYTRGYSAKDYVYGWAHDKNGYPAERIRSRKERQPNPFLQECINQFNASTPDYIEAMFNEEYINKTI